jgi:hypothetical protein
MSIKLLPPKDFLVSPKYRYSCWETLTFQTEADWQLGIGIVEDRIRGRFIRWIEVLISEQFSGFAVVALDCLFLETLWGFQNGKACPGDQKTYSAFLTGSRHFKQDFDPEAAESFHKNVRSAIVHDGETRRYWFIERNVPAGKVLERDSRSNCFLNRTEFHRALVSEFEEWLKTLRDGDRGARDKMRKRMIQIGKKHSSCDL